MRSSCRPSKRKARSSWESCCWNPLNLGAYFAMVHYKCKRNQTRYLLAPEIENDHTHNSIRDMRISKLYSPRDPPGQNAGVGSHSLLQGIFPTQGSNPGLPNCRRILYQLSHQGSPRILEWVAYPFTRGSSRPRTEPGPPALQVDSLPAEPPGKPQWRHSK